MSSPPERGSLVAILRRPEVRLFLTATSILFVELLLIRWIPANVIYVGYFRNFLLMASFLGIGVGILWGRDPKRLPISPFGPLLPSLPPLKAYSIDIVGSMTGVALFTVLSATGTPPIVWFATVAVLASLMGLGTGFGR